MRKNIIAGYLLFSPALRGYIEWGILVASGILGWLFSWTKIPFAPVSNIAGVVIFGAGLAFHCYSERTHRQAHQQAESIRLIITTGMYARIRHPLYLSVIIMNIGIALICGNIWSLILVGVILIFTIMTVFKEEAFLREKFHSKYGEYMKEVPWRMIPGIF